ncbi:serine/threonine protein kinase [Hyphomonas sp. WL0036]|uniref:serine/threonine protein kinase n=1 Tax=Hyphomonas sediminis TaxID=2866160 RepID=UPI001C7F022E|nr:serine/threonine-protein kinase [Hyphomonas sediminis]MBY9067477.1 serine/threonine protein kinase [Hyphomonas sediminis]
MNTGSIDRFALEILSQALDMPSDQRATWVREQCAGNEILEKRVLSLLEAERAFPGALKTGGARHDTVEPDAPERVGAYRITEIIGQGGMGAVYKGERDSGNFEHTVAIKIIRPGVLSEALIDRFERERQILATLNHPNIARLYDGGEMENGSPYMIMEFVNGEPILSWADRTGASLEQRLDLFQDLCNAVQFAHQNLIIHRDITPSNVLVNQDGLVKLIDFGISKSTDPSPTSSARSGAEKSSMSYTPGYAAPERERGAAANTLSDIFSLGKLLGDLVKHPERNAELNAIINCASAATPDERYASVDALNEDITNYRSRKPVAAFAGSRTYRMGKFISRHRVAVLSLIAVIVGLSAALATTVAQYNRAEAALAVANNRFTQARELSRTLVFDVYDEAEKLSGSLDARKSLAGVVKDYITGLQLDEDAPDDVLVEVGIITSRLADLYGGVGIANLGENELSMQLFLDAQKTLQEALQRNPTDKTAIAELLMVERMLTMQNYYHKNDLVAAHAANDRARNLAEEGLTLGAEGERPILRHFWSIRTDELQLLDAEGKVDEALEKVRQWRTELTPEMTERIGSGVEMQAYFASQEAMLLIQAERGAEALEPLNTAITLRSEQLAERPDNYYFKTQLMVAYGELATASRLAGNMPASREAALKALEMARALMAENPEDMGGPEGVSSMLQKLATAEHFSGNQPAAETALEEAGALLVPYIREHPTDTFYLFRMLNVLSHGVELDAADPTKSWSCARIREAQTVMDMKALLADENAGWDPDDIHALLNVECGN